MSQSCTEEYSVTDSHCRDVCTHICSSQANCNNESLTKWNLIFSGESCVREFFLRVQEEGIAWGVSPSYVVRRFHELLAGSALKYFRAIRCPGLTYSELRSAFFRTFDVVDYEFKIERQLRALTQESDQSVVDFIIEARYLNSKLSAPVSEDVFFKIIKYGMHPKYHPCLANNVVKDIDGLLGVAKNFEAFQDVRSSRQAVAPVCVSKYL